ncbi:hypothetical protein BDZ89DRAFT_1038317 [Hymenopellis radicata]|nr:hypothetical protein BDZ89DRAFT_1038317 [Hymenopellis radicata]
MPSSHSSGEQTLPSSESRTHLSRPIPYHPVPLSGDETHRPSHEEIPVPSTSAPSSRSYSGTVCRGTVSTRRYRRNDHVSDIDAKYVESVIGETAPSTFRHGLDRPGQDGTRVRHSSATPTRGCLATRECPPPVYGDGCTRVHPSIFMPSKHPRAMARGRLAEHETAGGDGERRTVVEERGEGDGGGGNGRPAASPVSSVFLGHVVVVRIVLVALSSTRAAPPPLPAPTHPLILLVIPSLSPSHPCRHQVVPVVAVFPWRRLCVVSWSMNADSKSSISTVVADMQSSDAAVVADLKSSDAVMVVVVRMRETPDHTLTRTFGWRPGLGLEWQFDMRQAQIDFEQYSTSRLEVALKSAVFESFAAFATFLGSLANTACHSIQLDIGQVHGPMLDSSALEACHSPPHRTIIAPVHLDESAAARQDDCVGVTLACCVSAMKAEGQSHQYAYESAAARQENCVGVALAGCLSGAMGERSPLRVG